MQDRATIARISHRQGRFRQGFKFSKHKAATELSHRSSWSSSRGRSLSLRLRAQRKKTVRRREQSTEWNGIREAQERMIISVARRRNMTF